jgi:hypothetical protein
MEPTNRSRRRVVLGGATVAVIATLANRRAFAGGTVCGPISRAGSLNPSHQSTIAQCSGLSHGYWKRRCPTNYQTVKLGSVLSCLNIVDPASAGMLFPAALNDNNSNACHWACAILNAANPALNPNYGYTLTSLNSAILAAYNNGHGSSANTIVAALAKLES